MAIFTETIEIDFDIEDFDIDEIIEYLESEGFTVIQGDLVPELDDFDIDEIIEYLEEDGYTVIQDDTVPEVDDWFEMNHAIWEYKYGSVKEAVKIIERCFPELNGLSEKIV